MEDKDLLKAAMQIVNKDASIVNMAIETYNIYSAFKDAGFTESQALSLVEFIIATAVFANK